MHTFSFLPGIGEKTQQVLWHQGIHDWDDFLQTSVIPGIGTKRKQEYDLLLRQAKRALFESNHQFFLHHLPQKEHWRLLPWFLDDLLFLDIETTGVTEHDRLLLVGCFDGYDTYFFLERKNLERRTLQQFLNTKKLLITFNGSSFDLPFLRKWGITFEHLHIDVKPLLQRLGFFGGLKHIEQYFGIQRHHFIRNMHGGDVYLLWRKYLVTGDDYYLQLLLEYNEHDVLSLKPLLFWAYQQLSKNINGISSFPTRIIFASLIQESFQANNHFSTEKALDSFREQ